MLVLTRFRVSAAAADGFRAELEAVRDLLARQVGFLDATVGRSIDDPELWVLSTRWEHAGAYRRALSTYEVKLTAVPLLSRALDEPGAYEAVEPGVTLNIASTRSLG